MVIAALALAVPITRRFGLAYGVFLLLMIVPPLFRGGFLSLGRLTSTLFPLFLYLGWRLRGTPLAVAVMAFAGIPGASGASSSSPGGRSSDRAPLRPSGVTVGGARPYLLTERPNISPAVSASRGLYFSIAVPSRAEQESRR